MIKNLLRAFGVMPSVFDRENILIAPSKSQPHEVAVGIKDGKEGLRIGSSAMLPLVKLEKPSPDRLEYTFENDAKLVLDYKKGKYTEYTLKVPSMDIKDNDIVSLRNNPRIELLGADHLDKIWDLYEKDNMYWLLPLQK